MVSHTFRLLILESTCIIWDVKKDDGYQPRYIHLNIDGVVVKYHGDAVVREGVGGVADQEAGLA